MREQCFDAIRSVKQWYVGLLLSESFTRPINVIAPVRHCFACVQFCNAPNLPVHKYLHSVISSYYIYVNQCEYVFRNSVQNCCYRFKNSKSVFAYRCALEMYTLQALVRGETNVPYTRCCFLNGDVLAIFLSKHAAYILLLYRSTPRQFSPVETTERPVESIRPWLQTGNISLHFTNNFPQKDIKVSVILVSKYLNL